MVGLAVYTVDAQRQWFQWRRRHIQDPRVGEGGKVAADAPWHRGGEGGDQQADHAANELPGD